jgi:hypothetical protein
MPALVAGIHVFAASLWETRGWRGQALDKPGHDAN